MSRFAERYNAYAQPMLEREHGEDVYLRRGALVTDTFTAILSNVRRVQLGSDAGVTVTIQTRICKLPKVDVVIAGVTFEPQVNDLIIDSSGLEWEIRTPSDDTEAVEDGTTDYDWVCHTERHIL